ncbi:glutathione S-transferase theta-1-like [Diadema antillarum]|uniref:glutathione S-transferase theta-1-like n=1 Tax=Diadema antillarum TaxID=105358 RepID=UPI003A8A4129
MVVELYVDMISQPSRSLVLFLKNTDIPFEVKNVKLFSGEHKTPEFAKITQLQTVPAIKDGDFSMAETIAIIRYLTTKYADKVADHWYPKDLEKRARADEYLSFHHSGTRGGCMNIFYSEVLLPFYTGKTASEERIQRDLDKLKTQLDKLERAFLKDNKFLLGDEISVADVLAVPEITQCLTSDRDVTEGRPKLKAYVERVKERLNPLYDEVHVPLFEWKDTLKK